MWTKIIGLFSRLERGASMVEYSLLIVFIAIVALLAVTASGNQLSSTYSEISSNLVNAGP